MLEEFQKDLIHKNTLPKTLDHVKDLLIFGEPIETFYGTFRFYSYKEYIENLSSLAVIKTTSLGFYYAVRSDMKKNNATLAELQELKKTQDITLFEHVKSRPEIAQHYTKVFDDVLKSDLFDSFSYEVIVQLKEEDFLNMRNIVLNMNMLKEEKMSPSPTVQDRLDKDREFKSKNSSSPNTETMFSALFVYTGKSYNELRELTAYQVISTYYRIHAINNFNTSVIFASVGAEIDWKSWDENNTIMDEQIEGMSGAEFNKNIGGLFK